MTQAEIAQEFGISQATVSYVLKGGGKVSPELRQKISERAREGGYLRKRQASKSNVVVVLNQELYRGLRGDRYMLGIQEKAQAHGLRLSHLVYDAQARPPASLLSESAGFILACLSSSEADLSPFLGCGVPCVFLNRPDLDGQGDAVMVDNAGGVGKAMRHLWGLGHRRIGFFGIRSFTVNRAERLAGYYQALAELDAPIPPPEWVSVPHRHEFSQKDVDTLAAQTLATWMALEERPTAAICSADLEALALMRQGVAAGHRIPDDLSVVGFDALAEREPGCPVLDSVWQPSEEMGRLAVELLLSRMENTSLPHRQWRVGTKLLVNDSAVAPNTGVATKGICHEQA